MKVKKHISDKPLLILAVIETEGHKKSLTWYHQDSQTMFLILIINNKTTRNNETIYFNNDRHFRF